MSAWQGNAEVRAWEFAEDRGIELVEELGAGYDGVVLSTTAGSAIKVFRYEELYQRERNVYLRLFEHGIQEICGCRAPRLLDYDDRRWLIEIGNITFR